MELVLEAEQRPTQNVALARGSEPLRVLMNFGLSEVEVHEADLWPC